MYKQIAKLVTLFVLGILAVSVVNAGSIPVTIQEVEINGDVVGSGEVRADLKRGDTLNMKVKLYATGDSSNVVLKASIDGYEHADTTSVEDKTDVFDVKSGKTYIKSMTVKIPDDIDVDTYALRLSLSDKRNDKVEKTVTLSVDSPRHGLKIKEVVTNPEATVMAGRSLLTVARLENTGSKDLDNVRVAVSIPQLGVSATDYVDEVKVGKKTSSEEIYMRIPVCADAGAYTMNVVAEFNDGEQKVTMTKTLTVTESDECASKSVPTITVPAQAQTVVAGGQGTVFPVTIKNNAPTTKTFVLSATAGDWATVSFTPGNVLVLTAGQSQTVSVTVSAGKKTSPGTYVFSVKADADGKTVQEATVTASVTKGQGLRQGLEVALVVLVILLVVLGLIVGFNKLRDEKDYF